MARDLYPLGSIVYLDEGDTKLMIVGRGAVFNDPEDGEVFFDYVGCIYPRGLDIKQAVFFQHEDISLLVFEGFKDSEEIQFMKIFGRWENELDVPHKVIN